MRRPAKIISVNIRLTREEAHDIDDARSLQKPLVTRSAMVKQLVREALAARRASSMLKTDEREP
jgi:hypothetical protein